MTEHHKEAMTFTTLLRIAEHDDPEGVCRLTLTGELDIASAPDLEERLRELGEARRSVRLDLSELDFMDSTGLAIVLRCLREAARKGWKLEVDREVSRQVARVIEVTGLAEQFWLPSGS